MYKISLQLGDTVDVMDSKLSRNNYWLLGKIARVLPESGGSLRIADMKTKPGVNCRMKDNIS